MITIPDMPEGFSFKSLAVIKHHDVTLKDAPMGDDPRNPPRTAWHMRKFKVYMEYLTANPYVRR